MVRGDKSAAAEEHLNRQRKRTAVLLGRSNLAMSEIRRTVRDKDDVTPTYCATHRKPSP